MARFRVTYAPTFRTEGTVEEIGGRDCVRDPDWILFRDVAGIRYGPPVIRRRVPLVRAVVLQQLPEPTQSLSVEGAEGLDVEGVVEVTHSRTW